MQESKGIAVKILGKDYKVACPEENEHQLIDAALHLDKTMHNIRNTGRVMGVERIAVMAALNLAYELLQLKSEHAKNTTETQKRVSDMYGKLEEALSTITIVD